MKTYFPDIVDVDFTANMEERLDDVEMGREEWKQIIRDFYPGFMRQWKMPWKNWQKWKSKTK